MGPKLVFDHLGGVPAAILTPERVASLAAHHTPPDQEVASALWSRILQLTFCHARRLLGRAGGKEE